MRAAARARVRKGHVSAEALTVPQKIEVDQVVALTKAPPRAGGPMVVVMGTSAGGTVTL